MAFIKSKKKIYSGKEVICREAIYLLSTTTYLKLVLSI